MSADIYVRAPTLVDNARGYRLLSEGRDSSQTMGSNPRRLQPCVESAVDRLTALGAVETDGHTDRQQGRTNRGFEKFTAGHELGEDESAPVELVITGPRLRSLETKDLIAEDS